MSKLILPVLNKTQWHPALGVWITLTMTGIPFRETFEQSDRIAVGDLIPKNGSQCDAPILYHGRQAVWGALGIMEYLAELFPEKNLWPKAVGARTVARAVSHELQSKLGTLSGHSSASASRPGMSGGKEHPVIQDKARIECIIRECRSQYGRGGKFLFGKVSIPDAVLAPILLFLDTHAVPVETETRMYMNAVLTTDAVASWREGALAESLKPVARKNVLHVAL